MILKFSYMPWAQWLTRVMGGADTAGWIHRACAVVTFGYFFFHLVDVWRRYRRSGKSLTGFLFGPDSMVPRWADVKEFGQTVKWFFGQGPRPRYGKWTYWEKFDYFAVFWGVAVIGSTGLCLWFPEFFTRFLPGIAINVAQIVHSDEALLATGFIFTIHFFNTHFRPEKFPMDTVIFTGRMPLEEFKHERPRWYEQLVADGTLDDHLAGPPARHRVRRAKIFGTIALLIGLILIVLIIYAMVFAYR
jgi:cytochrome b subunit of formate dehydrogenase